MMINCLKRIYTRQNTDVPRIIWILWLQGWEGAPLISKKCLETWQKHNPNWKINVLAQDNLSNFINLDKEINGREPKSIPYAALSDIIRICLLRKYGGVWVDSTLYCKKPLDTWVFRYSKAGFFAFSNPGKDRLLSSWFLVAGQQSYIVDAWARATKDYWSTRTEYHHYFWFHYLFGELYELDKKFKKYWDKVPKWTAKDPHYFIPYKEKFPLTLSDEVKREVEESETPVYKLTHKFSENIIEKGTVIDYLLKRQCG